MASRQRLCERLDDDVDVAPRLLRSFELSARENATRRQEERRQEQQRLVPLLQTLSNEILAKMSDVLEVDFYPPGVYIIRQGTSGDTFFIISHGNVKVTQRIEGTNQEEQIRVLGRGDYFGEQALLREDKRTANVVSLEPGVECLALDRESFIQLIGDLRELQDKHYDDRLQLRPPQRITSKALEVDSEVKPIQLDDLEVLATLGVGGFGRVELVSVLACPNAAESFNDGGHSNAGNAAGTTLRERTHELFLS
ncbi:hypothetical protein HPB49_010200 [Dermacentor silvarum]|uniref:Uncharacterized protein n=1 Tax=Dermacentor silvarum TaxID=543639 RepID=A0ACB8DYL7_DERSI|nr:hypothetical protein HPB49_010200 [Dermacentor silvarum]